MSSFAGVSVVTDGKLCTTSAVDVVTDSGYHLLVVNDFSRTVRETPDGEEISSGLFMVGGRRWYISYNPNGTKPSCADFISFSVYLCHDDDDGVEEAAKAKYEFSFVDQVEKQKTKYIHAGKTFNFSVKDWGSSKFIKRDVLERSGYLKDGCFTIRCDIMVCKDHNTQVADDDVHQHFDRLLKNKVGADVTFEVSGETLAAHRCVLAARSKVFMAQLFGPMTEGVMSTVIQIKDMDPKVFAALLSFIYTDSFPKMDKDNNIEEEEGQDEEEEAQDEEEGQQEHVMWLQDLLVAADRYDVQRLKSLCENRLSGHIGVSSVASTLALAEQHHCHRLKEACFMFIQLQPPECLDKVMATDGWEYMITTYPSVLNELIAKLVSNQKKGKKRKYYRK